MPRYPEYVRAVHAARVVGHQPRAAQLVDGLIGWSRGFPAAVPIKWSARRLTAALVSFTDDHDGPFPEEWFPAAIREVLEQVNGLDRVDLPAVLELSACRKQPTTLDGILVAHGALRHLARGRDDRALGIDPWTLERRLEVGARVLPFHPEESLGGDPLGDCYHYLATLAAGLAGSARSDAAWMLPLFAVGPNLMSLVRDRLAGSTLFFGNHAAIDRMGLQHGRQISRSHK